jgi:hypothetical protein
VKALIEDYAEKIFIVVNEDNIDIKISEIKHLIDNIGIRYVVYIDEDHLDNVLKEYLGHYVHENYGEFIVGSSAINDIIGMCIDGFCKY